MMATSAFTACKVFSATTARDRQFLGERVTEWLRAGRVRVVDYKVTQSSDAGYHCISITVFYAAE